VVRAKIVLMAADGLHNKEIAHRPSLPVQVVTRWRKRFYHERLPGLQERPRTGRPATQQPNSSQPAPITKTGEEPETDGR